MTSKKLKDAEVTGALAERIDEGGRRRIKLRAEEREVLQRRQRAEAAAALFLDLEQGRTWAQIAQEIGISPHQLRDVTKSPEFDEAYNQLFGELGHDPRFRAAQGALADMLPLAIRELKKLITSENTAGGVRLRAIIEVLRLNGLAEPQQQQTDRQELAQFLNNHQLDLVTMRVPVPPEYLDAYRNFLSPAVIDGEIVEAPDEEQHTP